MLSLRAGADHHICVGTLPPEPGKDMAKKHARIAAKDLPQAKALLA